MKLSNVDCGFYDDEEPMPAVASCEVNQEVPGFFERAVISRTGPTSLRVTHVAGGDLTTGLSRADEVPGLPEAVPEASRLRWVRTCSLGFGTCLGDSTR